MSDKRNAKPAQQKGAISKPSCSSSAPGVPNKTAAAAAGRRAKPKADVEKAVSNPTGFERNLEPERILEAVDCCGRMHFLMKWRGLNNELDLVCAEKAKILCPAIVIDFYERNLTWVKPSVKPLVKPEKNK